MEVKQHFGARNDIKTTFGATAASAPTRFGSNKTDSFEGKEEDGESEKPQGFMGGLMAFFEKIMGFLNQLFGMLGKGNPDAETDGSDENKPEDQNGDSSEKQEQVTNNSDHSKDQDTSQKVDKTKSAEDELRLQQLKAHYNPYMAKYWSSTVLPNLAELHASLDDLAAKEQAEESPVRQKELANEMMAAWNSALMPLQQVTGWTDSNIKIYLKRTGLYASFLKNSNAVAEAMNDLLANPHSAKGVQKALNIYNEKLSALYQDICRVTGENPGEPPTLKLDKYIASFQRNEPTHPMYR